MAMSRVFRVVAVGALVGILMGCADADVTVEGTQAVASETAVQTEVSTVVVGDPTSASMPDSAESANPPAIQTPIVQRPLSMGEQFLLFTARSEQLGAAQNLPSTLWGVNANGTGLTQLTSEPAQFFDVSPVRGVNGEVYVVYMTVSEDEWWLKLLTLPEERIETVAQLTQGDSARELMHNSMQVADWLKWSPDGRWLAFLGAMDTGTVDVYSYELATGLVRHLTSGEDQAFQILWSPDSRLIMHTSKDSLAQSGGIFEGVSGVWGVPPDGGTVIKFEDGGDAQFLGWVDEQTVALYSGEAMGINRGLRTISMGDGQVKPIGPNCFQSVAFSPEYDTYLITVIGGEKDLPGFNCENEGYEVGGTYLLDARGSVYVSEPEFDRAVWTAEADRFFANAYGGLILPLLPNGERANEQMPTAIVPLVSPDGSGWAWLDEVLWIRIGDTAAYRAASVPVTTAIWHPDNKHLFFFDHENGVLYLLDGVSRGVVRVGTDLYPGPSLFYARQVMAWTP